ncbi:sodium:phosphate symporter [Halolactibacillus alkaliphilus]|uniref:Sodium:phosphate symporter n=1 Tax=Halolactibacillus alkaliphilus TaxID=442899 RepID=A0A511X372_9BACI|nr:Na/Pi cotransporter family protein [Halolactibacillus alkaliphilus]GEN57394.1 sodium:phosphate symporter [Halolactibacillus alkaliphilus]GGN69034.1 sodium:phosphate symporter [Halolactibacillus alkaliphilus]SFO73570.1 phosphate:Na+ symporter [Halolactibacillus alkaliphilus]
MEINIQQMLFEFFGGLGIFLLGIKYMGEGLQKTAGDRLKDILDKFTSNPLMGVLAGIVVTILLQTSTGTTVLAIGLVNAGFMTFRQSIGVIMGANVGTTVTAFIIGIDIGAYALPIVSVGALLMYFAKNQKLQNYGQATFGFGALFFGLELMGDGLYPLRYVQAFQDLTVEMSEVPILGLVIGMVFTFVVQSSSATIGILQSLVEEGMMGLDAALPVLFGNNVGTTITAVIASIGASIAARRAAVTHVIFNLMGALIIMLFLPFYQVFIEYLTNVFSLSPKMSIAFAHGVFNVANLIIFFPFIALLAKLVQRIVPGEDSVIEFRPTHLDPIFIQQAPGVALEQAKEEIIRMGEYAYKGLEESANFLNSHEQKHADNALQIENALNKLDQQITEYLIALASAPLSDLDSEKHTALIDSVRDIERIGDHFENIVELIEYKIKNKIEISDDARGDLNEMFDKTKNIVQEAIEAISEMDREKALDVVKLENQIDRLEKKFRKKHIIRLNEGACSGQSGIVYVDILSNLERIGDHALNIAEDVLGEKIPETVH